MQNRTDETPQAERPQPATEPTNPESESRQIAAIEDEQATLAKIKEVDTIAQRERERIQQAQIAKYGELVRREDEPLYGLSPIEGGAHEVPKEEPGPAGVSELNLTWVVVIGGLLILFLFAAVLWYSFYLRPDWGIVHLPISPDPYR